MAGHDPAADLEQACAAVRDADWPRAAEALGRLRPEELNPAEQGRMLALTVLLVEQEGDPGEADALQAAMANEEEGAPARLNGAAITFFDLGRPDRAESALRELAAVDTSTHIPLGNLSMVLRSEGRLEEALEALEQAADRAPEAVDVWHELMGLLAELGRLDAAADAARACTRLAPDDVAHWLALGALETDRGAYPEAQRALVEAYARAPEEVELHVLWARLGQLWQRPDLLAEAVARLERIAPHDPRTADARRLLEATRG
jgi:tetratricopeptide (TPR) repeat protein